MARPWVSNSCTVAWRSMVRVTTRPSSAPGAGPMREGDVEDQRCQDVVAAVYGAPADLVEHAYRSRDAGLPAAVAEVTATFVDDQQDLDITVADHGRWRPGGRERCAESRGRGMGLITALTTHTEVATTGSTVTISRHADPPPRPRRKPARYQPPPPADGAIRRRGGGAANVPCAVHRPEATRTRRALPLGARCARTARAPHSASFVPRHDEARRLLDPGILGRITE